MKGDVSWRIELERWIKLDHGKLILEDLLFVAFGKL